MLKRFRIHQNENAWYGSGHIKPGLLRSKLEDVAVPDSLYQRQLLYWPSVVGLATVHAFWVLQIAGVHSACKQKQPEHSGSDHPLAFML